MFEKSKINEMLQKIAARLQKRIQHAEGLVVHVGAILSRFFGADLVLASRSGVLIVSQILTRRTRCAPLGQLLVDFQFFGTE